MNILKTKKQEKQNSKKKIRSFIYLDDYKMYSISSQLFEGLTEYMIKTNSKKIEENESQQGRVFSGKMLADIFQEYTEHAEKKFLHDYSYNLFEEALIDDNRVIEFETQNITQNIRQIHDYTFVKVSGKLVFNDLKMLEGLFKDFNRLGEAIHSIESYNENSESSSQEIYKTKSKNIRKKAKQNQQASISHKKLLIEKGYHIDQKFLDDIVHIINFGYKSQFEVYAPFIDEYQSHLFSAILNRQFLKEKEHDILRKYSRETEKTFTIFGILTQTSRRIDDETILDKLENMISSLNTDEDDQAMREVILELVNGLLVIDKQFFGRLDYEYIIDPIAIYREL